MQKKLGTSEGMVPVDAFGGFVAVDKYDKDNLENTQKNIQWKTQLHGDLVMSEKKGVI